jgi:hypothetical protein
MLTWAFLSQLSEMGIYMSRIRGPYVRFCERDEAAMPHPTRYEDVRSWWRERRRPVPD